MPPLEIELSPPFRSAFKGLPEDQRSRVSAALALLPQTFGFPHRHAGLGIRRLRPGVYEFRIGRDLRAVFEVVGRGKISLSRIGNHDDVRRFLKTL
jgi:mRNA-degrading endonuclease RelE of RelBE toxin-antitoxin system